MESREFEDIGFSHSNGVAEVMSIVSQSEIIYGSIYAGIDAKRD